MIMVQKPAAFPSSPLNIHRRHPSAPSPLVVQPTRTPGLLALTKPLQQQQQPQSRQRHSPKAKQASPKASARPQQQQENVVAALKPSPEITDKKSSPADKSQQRGRQHAKPKDKPTTRSSSHSELRGRRHNARQPSPPLPPQAEVSTTTPKPLSSNPFDPFSDDSPVPSRSKAVRPAPTLASRPSGKLAKRRQPNTASVQNAPTPASSPAKGMSVPRRNTSYNAGVSRSAPGLNHIPSRFIKASTDASDRFPICDDVSEAGDPADRDEMHTPPPRTPTPTQARTARFIHGFDDGPRTAPIAVSTKSFPFTSGSSPTPAPAKRGRRHARVPSEGVFAMSSDEEASTGGVGAAELKSLFGMLPRRRPTVSMTESDRERAAAAAVAAYFASSNFQNSPSPEELPPPSFV